MSRIVKIKTNLRAVNKRVEKSNGMTCLRSCPKLREKNEFGVTFRQTRFCPILATRLMDDTAPCDYGRRLIASANTKRWKGKRDGRPKR